MMTPDLTVTTAFLVAALLATGIAAAWFAILYHRNRHEGDVSAERIGEYQALTRRLQEAGLLPPPPRPGEEPAQSPIVALTAQLKGLQVLFSGADASASLAELRRQITELESLRLQGPTKIELVPADRERFDGLSENTIRLEALALSQHETHIKFVAIFEQLSHLAASLALTNESLIRVLEIGQETLGDERLKTSTELLKLNTNLVELTNAFRRLVEALTLPPSNERQPLQLVN